VDYLAVHGVDKAVLDPGKIQKLQAAAERSRKPMVFLARISTSMDPLHDRIICTETYSWLS